MKNPLKKYKLNKEDLINMIRGIGIKPCFVDELRKKDLIMFCGDQHNEDWAWTNKIDTLLEIDLLNLYNMLRNLSSSNG